MQSLTHKYTFDCILLYCNYTVFFTTICEICRQYILNSDRNCRKVLKIVELQLKLKSLNLQFISVALVIVGFIIQFSKHLVIPSLASLLILINYYEDILMFH